MPSTCKATVFYDDAGEASARIYALAAPTVDGRLLTVDELAECRLECRVEGPKCRYSTTLPTRVKLTHRGVTNWGDLPALMAEACLPDPCHWSPELPFLYRVIGEVRYGERVIAEIDQTFGIRPISVVRNRIKFQGKTWVPRVVRKKIVVGTAPLELWRETATTMLVDEPDDVLCDEASEIGVVLMARLSSCGAALRARLRHLSRFPAVVAATLPEYLVDAAPSRDDAKNTLLIQETDTSPGIHVHNKWSMAYLLVCGRSDYAADWVNQYPFPILVERRTGMRSLAEAREACDELQRDLALSCEPAGYVA